MREGYVLRFLLAGGFNTAVTYIVYLVLLPVTKYQLSYTIAFVSGIVISYVLGRVFVFKEHRGYSSAILLPLIYLIQYFVSAAIVWAWVDLFYQQPVLAPLIAIMITLPLTFILSKFAFVGKMR